MKEIDIWIAVLKEDGYIIKDELSRIGSDTNILEMTSKRMTLSTKKSEEFGLHARIWFNYKTGEVSTVNVSRTGFKDGGKDVLNKADMLKEKADRFRHYKLESILPDEDSLH